MIHAVCIAQEQTVNCSALTIYCCCCTVCMFCTSLARTWCRLTRAAQNVSMYCTNDIRVDRIPWNRIEKPEAHLPKRRNFMCRICRTLYICWMPTSSSSSSSYKNPAYVHLFADVQSWIEKKKFFKYISGVTICWLLILIPHPPAAATATAVAVSATCR